MKVIFHKDYCIVYSSDPAATLGRMEAVVEGLEDFRFSEPERATEEDVSLVHTRNHIEYVKESKIVYPISLLAVGGSIQASESAVNGEPSFGVIRPPGHHASQSSSWGFCYFNNVAISVERLRRRGLILNAIILDIDLHYGDGTANIFRDTPEVLYHHVASGGRESFFKDLADCLESIVECDIVAVSAGFDRHEEDWGGILKTEDYRKTGEMVRSFAEKVCGGRRYAVLEGGYNHKVLGKNVRAFVEGFE